MKSYIQLFFLIVFFTNNGFYSQNISPDRLLQVRSFLNDKGIDEDKLIEELNNQGINIENMSDYQNIW